MKPVVAEQFSSLEQQKLAAETGTWVFLASEILFFGTIFLAIGIYRTLYPEVFTEGTKHLSLFRGTLNTAVLLTSSLAMAFAVKAAEEDSKRTRLWLWITAVMGLAFLGIKATEYYTDWQEHLIPAWNLDTAQFSSPKVTLFFLLYFLSTVLHALHLTIGIGLVSWLNLRQKKNASWESASVKVEMVGLYWHFVDLVWVFLYPALYLIGRS